MPTSRILSPEYLRKVAALADVWRPYGVRMYVSRQLRRADAAGRVDHRRSVGQRRGGLVEGQGRRNLRSHSRLWRFSGQGELRRSTRTRKPTVAPTPREPTCWPTRSRRTRATSSGGRLFMIEDIDPDRAKRAYIEFTRLDGQFRPNVVIQVKNGPIDFQPREPFHPLFGGMKQTPVIAEIQATQEYHRPGEASSLSRHDVGGVSAIGHACEGQRLNRRQSAGGKSLSQPPHGNGFRDESRLGHQLVRASFLAVELVCVRTAGVESGTARRKQSPTNGRA